MVLRRTLPAIKKCRSPTWQEFDLNCLVPILPKQTAGSDGALTHRAAESVYHFYGSSLIP
jgi:hypothetical protein